ncbi:YihY/virulence factor BrkB family protein [Pelagicoccus sp. SDUM812003]|uniref:YihY/virulence factor BrkB family protein n=1 Tax=Pelagicoccus sp. SDUM812003 TaxID=3041267 RepID=UPI00280F0517|nr:YihY/virulence factor BrkB family protein [Pelagicoccus sp. SDUM812003]MDQ8204329.1 YihY/virulence factor BrkB family protein [Pelagicoccus sp. SDUM812003]
MKTLNRIRKVLTDSAQGWMEHKAIMLAAALAFYTALSLAPLLTMIIFVAGVFWGEQAAEGFLVDKIATLTDRTAANFIETIIANAQSSDMGSFAGLFSFLILIWGSTRLFSQLQTAFDIVWGVEGPTAFKRQVSRFARQRLTAFGMTLVVAFILLVSLIFDAAVSYAATEFDLPGQDWFWRFSNGVISLLIVWGLFAFIYKILPQTPIRYRDALVGAMVASLLFTFGKSLFTLYLTRQESVYGASGSLMAVLLWVYFSAQTLFFGAEVARSWQQSKNDGSSD